jgi:hypothetical protein
MDAKSIRSVLLLGVLSLLCATTAWVVDHAVFASVFSVLSAVAAIEIAWDRWG